MERWRLLPYDVGPSAAHFALGDALVRNATVPTVWWHSTTRETLILGPRQADETARATVVDVVRRQSGGTAVLARPGVLGLDVVLPRSHPLIRADVVESYRWLGEVWLDALRRLDVNGHLVSIAEARSAPVPPPLVRKACFGSLSPYEVTVEGRKLVGLAQVRRTAGILLQSGIHLTYDAGRLAALLAPGDPDLPELLSQAGVGLNELSPAAGGQDTMDAFTAALAERLAIRLDPGDWTAGERTRPEAARP